MNDRDTLGQLLAVARELGGVIDCNDFTDGLAARLEARGVAVDDMAAGDLVRLIRPHADRYNRVFGRCRQ